MEMVQRQGFLAGVLALVVAGLLSSAAFADKKEVKTSKEWSGAVEDETLAKDAPAVVADAKALEKIWKAWKIEDKMPEVDFTKDIVVITTTRGSKVNLMVKLDDKGNLDVVGLGTRDLVPGFRYVIATVAREGVKTVNGKEFGVKKEEKKDK
jgi:hypothetical protein